MTAQRRKARQDGPLRTSSHRFKLANRVKALYRRLRPARLALAIAPSTGEVGF